VFSDSSSLVRTRTGRSVARTRVSAIRERAREQSGIGLIELLVVVLIIAILAAIAIPSFLNQKTKAYDASAKELAHTAEVTAETYASDNNSYAGMSIAALQGYESSLTSCPAKVSEQNGPCLLSANPTSSENNEGYVLVTRAANTGDEFTITRTKTGALTHTCSSTSGTKTGCSGSSSGSW
jgi:type IV pilus assembly protein PilA